MLALSNKKSTFVLNSGFFDCFIFTILFKYYAEDHFFLTKQATLNYQNALYLMMNYAHLH